MPADPKGASEGIFEASSKLDRLLETEDALEAMLKEARREAEALVEAARTSAADRVRQFESQLDSESAKLRERIERERDHTIDSIRKEARREVGKLSALDDAKITELARHVIDLLVGGSESRGPR